MSEITIRIARPDEHARALAAYEAWGYFGGVQPENVVYLAEADGELVGVVRRTHEHGVTMLRGMQVAPEWRRRGVGTRLLRALVAELGGEECHCVPYAHLTRFYGAAGFREIGDDDTPPFLRERLAGYRADGLSVLVMRRPANAEVGRRAPGDDTGTSIMDESWNGMLWRQFAAAIDMLENAITACPDDLWGNRERRPEFWYVVYHTLFLLDLYVEGTLEGWAPPEPYNMDELDPAGVLPPRVYTKEEMRAYLRHGREKTRAAIAGLTEEKARRMCTFSWLELSYGELMLDSLRHVQHHTAQLNLILRQVTDSAPRWVSTTKGE